MRELEAALVEAHKCLEIATALIDPEEHPEESARIFKALEPCDVAGSCPAMSPASKPEKLPLGHRFKRDRKVADYCIEWAGTGNCGKPERSHAAPPEPERHLYSLHCADHWCAPQDMPKPTPGPLPEPPEPAQPAEPACVCGYPNSVGVQHRTDGPCYMIEPPAPAQPAVDRLTERATSLFRLVRTVPCAHGPRAGKGEHCSECGPVEIRAALESVVRECADEAEKWAGLIAPREVREAVLWRQRLRSKS